MDKLTHFSLFTGIGGIDLSAEWAGFETVGQCEFADYPTKVLEKHWPDVPRWRDVRDVTRESVRHKGIQNITLLSGGFPCQPHSVSGLRLASGDERDLWGEFARIILQTNPRWVLGENVGGILSSENGRFFGRILRDLAGLRYHVGWLCYGSSLTGSNQNGKRVFILAAADGNGLQKLLSRFAEIKKIYSQRASDTLAANSFGGFAYQRRNWPAESGICRMVNALPNWVDRLKCLGNAVDPYQVYPILKAISEIENNR